MRPTPPIRHPPGPGLSTLRLTGVACLVLTSLVLSPAGAQSEPAPQDKSGEDTWAVVERLRLGLGSTQLPGAAIVPLLDPASSQTMSLAAVGDVIPHATLMASAEVGDGHDFRPIFAAVKERISGYDLAVANLETPVAGADLVIGGYPMFNAPDALPEALQSAGFDAVTTANNHSLDRREQGVLRTLSTLDRIGLPHAGTAAGGEPGAGIAWLDSPLGKVALLSWTYDTNGMLVPKARPWLVNSPIRLEGIADEIRIAREAGARLVLVALHWGREYEDEPRDEQRQLAADIAVAGADAILGSHPHVLQPAELLTLGHADGTRRYCPVFYSLGNFASNQRDFPRDLGAIASIRWVNAPGLRRPAAVSFELHPTWVDNRTRSGKKFRVLEVAAAQKACSEDSDQDLDSSDCRRLRKVSKEAQRLFPQAEP